MTTTRATPPASRRIRVSVLPSSSASASPSLSGPASAIGPREDAAWRRPHHRRPRLRSIIARFRTTTNAPSRTYPPPGAEEETRQPPSLLSVRRPSPCSSAASVMRFSAGAGARGSPASSPHRRTTNHASV
ncbi:hypothetical protein ACQJBY_068547 [Aegilops geniculata]